MVNPLLCPLYRGPDSPPSQHGLLSWHYRTTAVLPRVDRFLLQAILVGEGENTDEPDVALQIA